MKVKEFFKFTIGGEERLCAVDYDGYVNVLEYGFDGDETFDPSATNESGVAGIDSYFLTRGYAVQDNPDTTGFKKAWVRIGTWNPSYTVKVEMDGAVETQTLVSSRTKSRTTYYRPFNAAAYDASNVNGDHATAYREDYSVSMSDAPITIGSGINFNQMQDTHEAFPVDPRSGKHGQISVTNTQGRLELKEAGIGVTIGETTMDIQS